MSEPIRFETGSAVTWRPAPPPRFQHADFGGQWRDFGAFTPCLASWGARLRRHLRRDPTTCEYMCAVEVAALEVLPRARPMRITPQTYAVFRHLGHVSTMPQTWQGALDWLAGSGWESAHKPDFGTLRRRRRRHRRRRGGALARRGAEALPGLSHPGPGVVPTSVPSPRHRAPSGASPAGRGARSCQAP